MGEKCNVLRPWTLYPLGSPSPGSRNLVDFCIMLCATKHIVLFLTMLVSQVHQVHISLLLKIMLTFPQLSDFQPWLMLYPRGYLAIQRHFYCHHLGKLVATGIQWVQIKQAIKYPTRYKERGILPQQRNISSKWRDGEKKHTTVIE